MPTDRASKSSAQGGAEGPRFIPILVLAAIVPLTALILFYRFDVPLGCPGRFVYRYSDFVPNRLLATAVAVLLALLPATGVWLLGARSALQRMGGMALVCIGTLLLGIWSYYAPPAHITQHIFNAFSPSHDGAFVIESQMVDSVPEYLAAFPERTRTPPSERLGTRVISNPPGATLLAVGIDRLAQRSPAMRNYMLDPIRDELMPELERMTVVGLWLFVTLTVMWIAAGPVLYAVARLWLPPMWAAAYAVVTLISPMTLMFTPGKDPAQLLTTAVPLLLWLLAWRRGWAWAGGLAGATFVIALSASLVHLWVAAIVGIVTVLSVGSERAGWWRLALRCALPVTAGAVIMGVTLASVFGLNLLVILPAVARAQATVTRGPEAMPFGWQLVGIPLFILFAGAVFWALALLTWRRRQAVEPNIRSEREVGGRFLIVTVIVLLLTAGFTNLETPRLWIPFMPLLLLGGFLLLHTSPGWERTARSMLAVLVSLQVTAGALQWSLMDPREAEYRISAGEFYGGAATMSAEHVPDDG